MITCKEERKQNSIKQTKKAKVRKTFFLQTAEEKL